MNEGANNLPPAQSQDKANTPFKATPSNIVVENANISSPLPAPENRPQANREDFLEYGKATESVELSQSDITLIYDRLRHIASAAQKSGTYAPDHAVFGTKALSAYQEAYSAIQNKTKPPTLTREQISAAYFAILSEEKLAMYAMNKDQSIGKLGNERFKQGERMNKWTADYLVDQGFDTWPKSKQEDYLKNLKNIRRSMYAKITGDKGVIEDFQGISDDDLVLGENQGGNKLHRAISRAAIGNEVRDVDRGIIGRDKYKEKYRGVWATDKEWNQMTNEERKRVWEAMDEGDKIDVVSESIEIGAGDFLEDVGKEIQLEVAGQVASEDARGDLQKRLEEHLHTSATHSRKEEYADKKEVLERDLRTYEKQLENLSADTSNTNSLAYAIEQYRTADASYNRAHGASPDSLSNQVNGLSNRINAIVDEINRITRECAKMQRDAKPQEEIIAYKQGHGYETLEVSQSDLQKHLTPLRERLNQIDDQYEKWNAVKTARENALSEAKKKLSGDPSSTNQEEKDGIRKTLLEVRKNLQTETDKEQQSQARGGHAEIKIPDSDKTAVAMERILQMSNAGNYSHMMERFYGMELKEFYDQSRNADGVSRGIDNFRKVLIESVSDILPNTTLRELMTSDLDYLRFMTKALSIPDVDISKIDTQKNRDLIVALNTELKADKPDDTKVKNARNVVEKALGSERDKVYAEIARRNKWQVAHALRIGVIELQNKVIDQADPFTQKLGEQKKPPVKPSEKQDSYTPPPESVGKKLEIKENPAEVDVVGVEAISQRVIIPGGSNAGEYFLVIRARQDTPGHPPTYKSYHEVYKADGTSLGEVSNEAFTNNRIQAGTEPLRENLLVELAMGGLNQEIDQSPDNKVAWNGHEVQREKDTNRLFYEDTTGTTKVTVYIDEKMISDPVLQQQVLDRGDQQITKLQDRLKEYYTEMMAKAGVAESSFELPIRKGKMEWEDPTLPSIPGMPDSNKIRVIFPNPWERKDKKRPVSLWVAGQIMGGNEKDIKGISSGDQLIQELTTIPEEKRNNYYLALYHKFKDYSDGVQEGYLKGKAGFRAREVIVGSEKYSIYAVDGHLMVRQTHDATGQLIVSEKQKEQPLENFSNQTIISRANYKGILMGIQTTIGQEYLRSVTNAMISQPELVDTLKDIQAAAQRLNFDPIDLVTAAAANIKSKSIRYLRKQIRRHV